MIIHAPSHSFFRQVFAERLCYRHKVPPGVGSQLGWQKLEPCLEQRELVNFAIVEGISGYDYKGNGYKWANNKRSARIILINPLVQTGPISNN